MNTSLTGDFAKLRDLVHQVGKLSGEKGAVHTIGEKLAKRSESLVLEQFGLQSSPTGEAWGKSLVKSGALASSFSGKVTARGTVVLTTGVRYAFPLAYGWGTGEQANRILAAGLRASQALADATDAKATKRAKRKLRGAARRAKRFGKLRGRSPARAMMPLGGSLGRWAGPLESTARSAFDGLIKA